MNCTDRRLVSICSDIFRIIKSGEEKGEVHGKEITVRKSASSGSSIVSLTIGLMSIDMIMKPFRVNDGTDSMSMAKDLLINHNVGLAPGYAFGQQYDSYLRLCFAASLPKLERGLEGISSWLQGQIDKK